MLMTVQFTAVQCDQSRCTAGLHRWRLNLLPQHAFDGLLELVVLGSVDERIDAAADEHQYDWEMVQPPGEVDDVVNGVDKE